MHTHLVAEGGAVVVEAVGEAGEGEEVDVEMDTMTMLMVVGERRIMPLSTWATDIPVEEGEVSEAAAGEVATVASLITNRMEAIMMRHLLLLRPEVVVEVVAVGEARPEAEDLVVTRTVWCMLQQPVRKLFGPVWDRLFVGCPLQI